MIKVPFRNPGREQERGRKKRRGESAHKHADRRRWGINTKAARVEELQNAVRRRISPLRMI